MNGEEPMRNEELGLETQRQRAFARLGSADPRCLICGEGDWRCLELHHIAGQAYDEIQVILCRNCHRKLSEPWANLPSPPNPPVMERAGRFFVGLANLLLELIQNLRRLGDALLEGAQLCPWPYGWLGAPEAAP